MPNRRISWHARVPVELAVSMLEPTLGWDKSAEVIEEAAGDLGVPTDNLTRSHMLRIFEALGMRSDLVGVAARFARTRLEGDASGLPSKPPSDDRPKSNAPSLAPPGEGRGRRVSVNELVDLFAPALGMDKSSSLVATASSELGLPLSELDVYGALAIIDRLAQSEGLVGVVAKFAKAQLILKVTEAAAEEALGVESTVGDIPPTTRTGFAPPSDEQESPSSGRLDELARKAGIAWVESLQEDFAQRKADIPEMFPETHHGARVWLMRALPGTSRATLKEQDLDRMVRVLFDSARREWEGTASSRRDP